MAKKRDRSVHERITALEYRQSRLPDYKLSKYVIFCSTIQIRLDAKYMENFDLFLIYQHNISAGQGKAGLGYKNLVTCRPLHLRYDYFFHECRFKCNYSDHLLMKISKEQRDKNMHTLCIHKK